MKIKEIILVECLPRFSSNSNPYINSCSNAYERINNLYRINVNEETFNCIGRMYYNLINGELISNSSCECDGNINLLEVVKGMYNSDNYKLYNPNIVLNSMEEFNEINVIFERK